MSGALVPWRSTFLANLRATGNVSLSAQLTGITRAAVYKRAKADVGFRRAFQAAAALRRKARADADAGEDGAS